MLKYKNCNIEANGRDAYIKGKNIDVSIKLYYDDDIDLINLFTMFLVQEFDCEHCNINGSEYNNVHVKMEKVDNNCVNIYFSKDSKSIYSILDT